MDHAKRYKSRRRLARSLSGQGRGGGGGGEEGRGAAGVVLNVSYLKILTSV